MEKGCHQNIERKKVGRDKAFFALPGDQGRKKPEQARCSGFFEIDPNSFRQ
jgi:hypothetical protein